MEVGAVTLHLEHPNPHARRWPMMRRDVAILLWASFLAACVATMLFFAMFDPLLLAHDDTPPRWLGMQTLLLESRAPHLMPTLP